MFKKSLDSTRFLSSGLAASVAGLALLISPAFAASDTWTGTTDATWATSTNWLGGGVPGTGDTATFDAASGNTTIDLGAGVTLGTLLFDTSSAAAYTIGSGAVGSQVLTLDNAGALTINSGVTTAQLLNSNIELSNADAASTTFTNNGTGLLTIAGTVDANAASGNGVLNVAGSGNITITGAVTETGAGNNALKKTGSGTLTLSNGSTFNGTGAVQTAFSGPFTVQEGTLLLNGGTHTVTGEAVIGGVVTHGGAGQNAKIQVDSGALNVSGYLSVGRGNGTGTATSDLEINNSATVSAQNISAGYNAGNGANLPKGTVTLNNTSSLTVNDVFNFGESAGSDFTMTLNDSATFNANGTGNNKSIGNAGNGTLIVNGTSTANFGGDVFIGRASNSVGNLVINGGTVNMATGPSKWMFLGGSGTSRGQIDITAGSLRMLSNSALNFSNGDSTGQNVVNQDGGSVTFYSNGGATPTVGGTGFLNMQRNASANSNTVYNLNGGTLTVPQILSQQTTGTRVFNFNGGTLQAAVATTAFMNLGTGSARANVRNGGALIDSNGLDVTVAQALVHSDIGGDNAIDGGLTKSGTGTLTLSGANTYTGNTTINAGGLTLASTGSMLFTVTDSTHSEILGTGIGTFDGTFKLDLTGVTASNTWTLVDMVTLDVSTSYGGTFSVVDNAGAITFTNSSGVWSGTGITGTYTFTQTSGALSFTAVPEPHVFALAVVGLLGIMVVARRRHRQA